MGDEFGACWKCSSRPGREPPPRRPFRWGVALALGVLFELGVVGLRLVAPEDSWLFIQFFNFVEYIHYPFLSLLMALNPESLLGGILVLLVVGTAMLQTWGSLLFWGWFLISRALARWGGSRRQKRLLAWCAGIAGVAWLACLIADAAGNRPMAFKSTPAVNAVVAGNTALALDLYRKLGETPGNLFFSPYSLS